MLEVRLDLGQGARPQLPAVVGGQQLAHLAALRVVGLAQVRCQVGVAQTLAGAQRKRRDRVRADAERLRDLLGRLVVDGRVPQHRLPALRERRERLGQQARLLTQVDPVTRRRHGRLVDVLVQVDPRRRLRRAVEAVAHRRQQVGAEGELRSGAVADRAEHADERLRGEVVGGGAAGQGRRETDGRGVVALEQRTCGVVVSIAVALDQLGVARVEKEVRHGSPFGW